MTTNRAPFGRGMLPHWCLDPQAVYLNHGTFGVTPRRVLETQHAMHAQIERHPARFMARELMSLEPAPPTQPPRLRAAAGEVAAFLGARGDDLVFVDNASAGVNAVLRSLRLSAGDEIVLFDHAYGAVARTAAFVARACGARVVTAALPFPLAGEAACLAALDAALTPRTRIAILDHITSETALVLPLARLAALCHARGVRVLADGAHAPGAIDVDIPSLGVDWYAGNLHKWAFAPRSSAILWAAPAWRERLHPPVISWGLGLGWHAEFDWVGTHDPTPFLCAPAGLAFIDDALGGRDALWAHNHALAWRSGERLTARWGLPWTTPRAMVGSMVSLPLPAALGRGAEAAAALKDWLLYERAIEAQILAIDDGLWLRISAQAYVDDEDIERLAAAIDERIASR